MLPLPRLLLEVLLLRYFQCSVMLAHFSLPCLILFLTCCSCFQAPTRAPPIRIRPRTLERPQQRPRTIPEGEGTSAGVTQGADVPSSSGSQTLLGRLGCPPGMMLRCWMPSHELSRQFLCLDTSLEPVFIPDTATHVSLFRSWHVPLASPLPSCC